MRFSILSTLAGCASLASGAIVWDGRISSTTELSAWSWSNQVGAYQYYIHGPSALSSYVNLSPSFKNPADSGSSQGIKITLDSTAYWNGQNMRRTELIPSIAPASAIVTGKKIYHFSISRSATNAPSLFREHQIAFFESHFTELKSGANSGQSAADNTLRWAVGGQTKFSVVWEAGVWYNYAYEIDFSANTIALWHSTGASPLVLTVPALAVTASSNGADFHVGVLELPVTGQADTNEDFFFSGVYIEDGTITTSVAGPGGVVVQPPISSSTTSVTPPMSTSSTTISKTTTAVIVPTTTSVIVQTTTLRTTTTSIRPTTTISQTTRSTTLITSIRTTTTSLIPTTTTSASGSTATAGPWEKCGGENWTGPTTCAPGWTCKFSNYWYSQCLQG